ncbi:dTMP kinase [Candidatus Wolfebacteria bacterium RIFOXYB1_FULL_54_12]|uniref:Thymidylate kinase n=1 Tax=Candidatus Wolfebacteria bacterium RIFOXYB1_FULL_54_12 TaxID=1802559 RepID=A0A1F8DWB3_9BACT|nr:MAG: dTMP kinase [Candidatus Wolfebacteria bacterium RIFOXYB1_FULL_54_12]
MKKGVLLVADGNEGAGKTTILNWLYETLKQQMGDGMVILTRQPGGTPLGAKIRSLLMTADPTMEISEVAELLLFCADRANHCDTVIRPALEAGKVVLCDRFDSSTIAHQIFGRMRHEYLDAFKMINAFARGAGSGGEIMPDMTLFFDVEFERGLDRVRARNDGLTKFDAEEHAFHRRVYEGFQSQLAANATTWTRIDANPASEVVKTQAWAVVSEFLGIQG